MNNLEQHTVVYTTGSATKSIYYLATGPSDGPLLILIHGWPGVAETWKPQILHFSSLGFRVIATDNPGYGNSTANKVTTDYSLENLVAAQLAVLHDTGRDKAIWLGHDWGCGMVWALVATHPEVCAAVANIAVPYMQLELGLEQLLTTVNRDIYPIDEYPNGPWDYQAYYESNFEDAAAWMDSDIPVCSKLMYMRGSTDNMFKPSPTSVIKKQGGYTGGAPKPPFTEDQLPLQKTVLDDEIWQALRPKMLKTGFWTANAYYANHAANRKYILASRKNEGVLSMPVLFIDAKYDVVCSSVIAPKMSEPMRENCKDLTEEVAETGHWAQLEKPEEVNSFIQKWLASRVSDYCGNVGQPVKL